jgi:hypothetical protein
MSLPTEYEQSANLYGLDPWRARMDSDKAQAEYKAPPPLTRKQKLAIGLGCTAAALVCAGGTAIATVLLY